MTEPAVTLSILRDTLAFAKRQGCSLYVVGGCVRDALLGRTSPPTNIDLAILRGALQTAQALATQLGGTSVCLDEEAGSARVVLTRQAQRVELDLSDFRGPTLEEDLRRRDFTINAMALPLETWCAQGPWQQAIIDPLNGRHDLAERRLRACFPETFLEDPVRILRAFRFAVELDMVCEPALLPLMAGAVARLSTVAGERIRDELCAILATDRAAWALQELNVLGGLDVLVPELTPGRGVEQGGYHHLDVLHHQLEAVAQCDRMLSDLAEFSPDLREPLADYCQALLVEKRSRKVLVKLAALVHDVGKPATRRVKSDGEIWFIGHEHFGASLMETLVERLRLSNREGQTLYRLVLYHLRPGHLSREAQLTRRAIFRFFRDLDEDGPACLLMWWADRMATRGPASRLDQIDQQRARMEELLRAYFFKAEEVIRPPRLLDGNQLMAALGMKPGPLVGRLLRGIEEAQAEGHVRSHAEALALARELLTAPDVR